MSDPKEATSQALEAHTRSTDELHAKLAKEPGCDTKRLTAAVEKYKAATVAFHDDALGCVGF